MIDTAYGTRTRLIEGLPKWAETTRFDVSAKVSEPDLAALQAVKRAGQQAMLQAVLAERFSLHVHFETKILAVLELLVAKGGPKFMAAPAYGDKALDENPGRGSMHTENGEMQAHAVKMAAMTQFLERELDETVVDRTGLMSEYDLHLLYLPERRPELADSAPRIATALPEQLGLRLARGKGPVEVLVVDSVAKPTEN